LNDRIVSPDFSDQQKSGIFALMLMIQYLTPHNMKVAASLPWVLKSEFPGRDESGVEGKNAKATGHWSSSASDTFLPRWLELGLFG
jgi:hypothetical protein